MRLHPIVAYKKKRNSKGRGTEICWNFLHNTVVSESLFQVTCSINKKYLQVQGGPRSILTDRVPAYRSCRFHKSLLNFTIYRPWGSRKELGFHVQGYMLKMWGGDRSANHMRGGYERRKLTILYITSKKDKIHSGAPLGSLGRSRVGGNQSVGGRK